MTTSLFLALLAAAGHETPIVDEHPFKTRQVVLQLVEQQANAVYVHHEEQSCKSGYTILIDVLLSAKGRPTDVKIVDPGCSYAKSRAEFLKDRILIMPPSQFKLVTQPTRFRLRVTFKWPEYEPTE
jgi:hypothetical protein